MILYWDVIAAGEQTKASVSKSSVPHGKNIIVNTVWVSMIYAIVKAKNSSNLFRRFTDRVLKQMRIFVLKVDFQYRKEDNL